MHESNDTVIQNARTVILKEKSARANITVLPAWQAPSAAAVLLPQVNPTLVKPKTRISQHLHQLAT
jgi:hypothetical protein